MRRTPIRRGLLGAAFVVAVGGGLAVRAEPADSSGACFDGGQWNIACLRTQYAGPASHWPAPDIDAGIAWTEWTTVPPPSAPPSTWLAANAGRTQLAEDIQKPDVVALGQMLFFDAHLSRKGQVSCASCHQPQRAFTDGRPLAVGEDRLMGRRRSTPLFAAPFAPRLFWDGRAESLKAQVLGPVQDSREMNHDLTDAIARLRNLPPYPAQFLKAFGPGDVGKDEAVDAVAVDGAAVDGVAVDGVAVDTAAVDTDRLARALAAFVATIRPQATRFDAFLNGHHNVLNDRELLGLHLFRTQARCMNCHNGPLLTDHQFHNVGLSFYGRRNQDLGRFEVTRDLADLGTFRTPSLRNVSQAGPWMHNGLFTDLKGLLRMYNAGMGRDAAQAAPPDAYAPRKSEHIRPLALSADDIDALLAFLNVL
ncbi:Cytochrome c551 peroxidase precursor [Achromobacter kerstersii]|nr:Cytochrome c551 peroxidase precursor [Achromobacter kerstersii]